MIVYGDHERHEAARDVRASVAKAIQDAGSASPGIKRHAALVRAFIRAAELVQGVADAEFNAHGWDRPSPSQEAGAVLLLTMANAIDVSWQSGFQAAVDTRSLLPLLATVRTGDLIKTRIGEGYAHYALYPESYLDAARASGLDANTIVIGIRSIGIGLGALVAAGLGSAPAISLRPVGHPFDREIRAAPDLIGHKADDPAVRFAIVDEGPGLSGSSFASVANWLQELGVATERMHFFPSHHGPPGASATSRIRSIWHGVKRHPARSDEFLCHPNGLRRWVESKLETVRGPLTDLSSDPSDVQMGPTDVRFARRKFMASTGDGRWLVKFAGLGEIGERKLRDAEALANAGFTPGIAGLCHGFLVQQWVEGQAFDAGSSHRGRFLSNLANYLAFRADRLGAPGAGASLQELQAMAVYNTSQGLGAAAAAALERRMGDLNSLGDRVRRVRTDNRLHAWEWIDTGGAFLKTDAVDHCEGHDLIGCQDIAWDVAGSIIEFNLDDSEQARLSRKLSEIGGVQPDKELISAMLPCYLAFQLGLWSTAPSSSATVALATSYAGKLSRHLAA
jgi:hypothetical protein